MKKSVHQATEKYASRGNLPPLQKILTYLRNDLTSFSMFTQNGLESGISNQN